MTSVALQDSEVAIASAASDVVSDVAEFAIAAVRDEVTGSYPFVETRGLRHPGWHDVCIRARLGLGGQVLAEGRAIAIDDYGKDPVSHPLWAKFATSDGMHGAACVPVFGPDGIRVLLYAALRRPEAPDGVLLGELERVADAASVGLHHVATRARERELAALRERQAMAIELHDSVAQVLFAIAVAAERSRQENDPHAVATALDEIQAMATAGRQELRETLARLNHAPEGLGFEALLEAELRMFERQTGGHVVLTRRGEPRDMPRPTEALLLDTLREGIRNATKHGRGRVTLASLSYEPEVVALSLQTELRADASRRPNEIKIVPGSGLGVLSERAERMHGGLELVIDSGDVAVLRLELPARGAFDLP